MLSPQECQETVSILYAMFLSADGACVTISVQSILTALVPFVLGVVLLQWMARKAWARITGKRQPTDASLDQKSPHKVTYDGGPIKSN